ncbi:hypothetical protein PHMEG_00040122, partial [Phytophthora megakarya]
MTDQDKTTDAATTKTGAPTAPRAPSELQLARPPPPIRVSKRVAKRKAVSVETEKMKKGKKKLVHDDVAPAPQAEVPSVAEERAPSTQESHENKSADPEGLPARVKLVLLYVNKWLGEALGHLQVNNPTWWGGFSSTVEAIDYKSPGWTMSLVNTLSQAGHQSGTTDRDQQRTLDVYGRREKSVPDDIRALVPTNRRGEEPCLRYLGGVMCSGGTRD